MIGPVDHETQFWVGDVLRGKVLEDGSTYLYAHGELHCDGGPAVMRSDGYAAWYWRGLLHRENGEPAVIHPDGSTELWYMGVMLPCDT